VLIKNGHRGLSQSIQISENCELSPSVTDHGKIVLAGEFPGGLNLFVKPRLAVAVAPLAFIGCLLMLAYFSPRHYTLFVIEDGLVEYATAFAYLGAAFLAVLSARRHFCAGAKRYGIVLLTFSGALFFVAMEEISWGQRLIGFDTPAVIAMHNEQGELTLHNLGGIQQSLLHPAYILVGFAGSLGPLLIPAVIKDKLPGFWQSILPRPQFFFYFFPTFAFYLANEVIYPYTQNQFLDWLRMLSGRNGYGYDGGVAWMHQEPVEFILSVGFLLVTYECLLFVRRMHGHSGAANGSTPAPRCGQIG
jgi:hypothetical protein